MAKFILILAIGGVVAWLWKSAVAKGRGVRPEPGPGGSREAGDAAGSRAEPQATTQTDQDGNEPMLLCARCGVYFPTSEVKPRDGLPYCSVKHRDAGPSDR